jgi:hypothetical protein
MATSDAHLDGLLAEADSTIMSPTYLKKLQASGDQYAGVLLEKSPKKMSKIFEKAVLA